MGAVINEPSRLPRLQRTAMNAYDIVFRPRDSRGRKWRSDGDDVFQWPEGPQELPISQVWAGTLRLDGGNTRQGNH